MPSLRQLRFLCALADELHFGRAAAACHVTQSTLSSGLKDLEATLGVTLAERGHRHVILTPIGEEITDRSRSLLAGAQDIVKLAARHTGLLTGDLRLGAIPTIGPYLIPAALAGLRQSHPDLRLYLREELTESLLEGVRTGRLDAALIALPFETGELETVHLFDDGYQLAAPRGHDLDVARALDGRELAEHSLLLLERGHCLQGHALQAIPEVSPPADNTFAATSLSTLLAMVQEGIGLTLIPQLAVDAGIVGAHDVSLVPLNRTCPRHVVLAWRPTSPRRGDFEALSQVFSKARADVARRGTPT
ncbi:LysR family transcriptional regulator [Rhodovibrio sodomensis]|uniref:LysR family transcriptional regulator n=2 Tax=Rhodovibrio sodomensis TaxID=1088 RepID=A0ABS1DJR7_9PROT|nr:hydrogen peroxide-inducible genes activator [Rhodovibrio sodomensis]MBK1669738.1 LysR family transcriptional regulator [Rhodovibrio sodomensis]